MEPSPREYNNSTFGRQSGVLLNDRNHISTRHLSNTEFLPCYSVSETLLHDDIDCDHFTNWLDDTM